MIDYAGLKSIHISCVILSFIGFNLRFGIRWWRPHWLRLPWLRPLPHIIDSLLFFSGLGMAIIIQQYPFTVPWLTAKLLGLLAYIACGMVALKHPRPYMAALALLGAYASFAYIVYSALTKSAAIW